MSFLQDLTGLTGAKVTDQVIASDLLAAGKMGAMALTTATLEAATPELRRLFQDSLMECLAEHERIYRLAQERGWYQAYARPEEQLRLDLELSDAAAQAVGQA